jgi:hypothetical protein
MKPFSPGTPYVRPGPVSRALTRIGGGVEEVLCQCPSHDRECVQATAVLFIAVWVYQTAVLALVAHQVFSADGDLHVGLVLGAMLIASLNLMNDSFVFLRAGWHKSGLNELLRGGLDLAGGVTAKIKAGLFLCLRILQALAFAQLTAIFVGLVLFRADIAAVIDRQNEQQNASLIARANADVDAEIQRATDAVKDTELNEGRLQKQIASPPTMPPPCATN